VCIRVGVGRNVEQRQIVERRPAKLHIDAAAADGDGQTVGIAFGRRICDYRSIWIGNDRDVGAKKPTSNVERVRVVITNVKNLVAVFVDLDRAPIIALRISYFISNEMLIPNDTANPSFISGMSIGIHGQAL
jgi:hypothetical protein